MNSNIVKNLKKIIWRKSTIIPKNTHLNTCRHTIATAKTWSNHSKQCQARKYTRVSIWSNTSMQNRQKAKTLLKTNMFLETVWIVLSTKNGVWNEGSSSRLSSLPERTTYRQKKLMKRNLDERLLMYAYHRESGGHSSKDYHMLPVVVGYTQDHHQI